MQLLFGCCHCLKEARPELQYLITDLQGLLSDTSAEVEIG